MALIEPFMALAEQVHLPRSLYMRELLAYSGSEQAIDDLTRDELRALSYNIGPIYKQLIDTLIVMCFLARSRAAELLHRCPQFYPLTLWHPLLYKHIATLVKRTQDLEISILQIMAAVRCDALTEYAQEWARNLHLKTHFSSSGITQLYLYAMFVSEWDFFLNALSATEIYDDPSEGPRVIRVFGQSIQLTARQMKKIREQRQHFDGLPFHVLERVCESMLCHICTFYA